MDDMNRPFCMDRLQVTCEGRTVDIPFGPTDELMVDAQIPWTAIESLGLELYVFANVQYGPRHAPHRTRLDLSVIKNGEKFRVISYGVLLLCDETEGAYVGDKTFSISFGPWE
jgi:hypothetical protein